MLAALLPALGALAPEVIRLIAGDKAGDTADRVAGVVRAVTGADSPDAVAAAIQDPQVAMQLRVRLAEIAAEQEAARRKADLEELAALLGDRASARSQTVALAQAGSVISWGAPVVSALVMVAFSVACWLVLTKSLPEGSQEIALYTMGALQAMASAVVAYWVGSSHGSARKDEALRAVAGQR